MLFAGGLVGIGCAVVAVNRAPIAERLARQALTDLGLSGSSLTIERLTPWRVDVRGIATGPAGTARIETLSVILDWSSWTKPQVASLRLDGLHLSVAVQEGGVLDLGDLQPLLARAGGGGGDSVSLKEVALTDSKIDVSLSGGAVVVGIPKAVASLATDGALILKKADFEVTHPRGSGQVSLSGRRSRDGMLNLQARLSDLQGSVGAVSLIDGKGRIQVSGDPAQPEAMDADAELEVSGLAVPGGMVAGGNLALHVKEGMAKVSADLADPGLGLTAQVSAEGSIFDLAKPAAASVQAQVADLRRLPVPIDISGKGAFNLKSAAPLAEFLSASMERVPALDVTAEVSEVQVADLPGEWRAQAQCGLSMSDGTAALVCDEPVSVSGAAYGGGIDLSLPLRAEAAVSPFRVASLSLGEITVAASGVEVAGGDVRGPLRLKIVPKGGGVTFRSDDPSPFPLAGAAFSFISDSPSLTLRGQGHEAVVRTARMAGNVALTVPDGAAPRLKLDVAGLDAHLPDYDVEAEGLSASLAGSLELGADWSVKAAASALRHTSVSPFSLTGEGGWSRKGWRLTGTLRQERSNQVASFAAEYGAASKTGTVRADTVPLNLATVPGGVHAMTPLLAPFVKSLTGTYQVSARTTWGTKGVAPVHVTASLTDAGIQPAPAVLPQAMKGAVIGFGSLTAALDLPLDDPTAGRGDVVVSGGNISHELGQVTGVAGRLELSRLWPPQTPPGQEFTARRIVAALPASDGLVRFQLRGADSLTIEQAGLRAIGGRLSVEDIKIEQGQMPRRVLLNVDGLGLADLAAQADVVGLKAEGRLSGSIPIELTGGGEIAIRDGLLEAKDKGLIAFLSPTRAPKDSKKGETDSMDLVLDILEDLRFEGMTLSLNGDARKDVRMRLRVHGKNPKIQQGRPVDLTVNLSGNLGEAIQAEFQNFNIQGLVGATGAGR